MCLVCYSIGQLVGSDRGCYKPLFAYDFDCARCDILPEAPSWNLADGNVICEKMYVWCLRIIQD